MLTYMILAVTNPNCFIRTSFVDAAMREAVKANRQGDMRRALTELSRTFNRPLAANSFNNGDTVDAFLFKLYEAGGRALVIRVLQRHVPDDGLAEILRITA